MPTASETVAIEARDVSKRFGGVYAVQEASLSVRPGTIHALVGENGAGKSTMLGMVSGRLESDDGVIRVFGDALRGGSPSSSRRHGIAIVYQELMMIPSMDAVANVFLGQTISTASLLRQREMRRQFLQLTSDFGIEIPPDTKVRDLSISQQQVIEILRAIQSGARIIMMDEPSAALAESEREVLYRLLNRLRAAGTTVVIVSHNLDEVLALSDDITVMREGRVVDSRSRSHWGKPELITAMVGRAATIERRVDERNWGGQVLSVSDVQVSPGRSPLSMAVREGEIVGLWGLVGSGRTSFMRSITGMRRGSRGSMRLRGTDVPWPRSGREAIRRKIVLLPESRKEALIYGMDAAENIWLGRSTAWIRRRREVQLASLAAQRYGFAAGRVRKPIKTLSGGNQQKILLAKWADRRPDVFFVDEPTRGIDIGAKTDVLRSLVELAKAGTAVVVTSSELEEVLAICDRLLVFSRGEIVAELPNTEGELNVEDIVRMGFGEQEEAK